MNSAEFTTLSEIKKAVFSDDVFVITDSNVKRLYPDFFTGAHAVIQAGEGNKNLNTVSDLIQKMVEAGCNRKTTVIAIGGGVVGDTAGFVASSYMRGVKWINVPTTLLAMVDSSIGGKTGVDVGGYKNVCGAFHLPERVLICHDWLKTLPPREWLCGCGEMIKHALLDEKILRETLPNIDKLISCDMSVAPALMEMSARFKESVVRADFKESGLRKILNVGHTVGHALEKIDGFRLSHGEYVAMGVIVEATMLKEEMSAERYEMTVGLARACLTCEIPTYDANALTEIAKADKKNVGKIVIMLPTGNEVKEIALTPEQFEEKLSCK
ncbi:MAG: 3-dehydroquinate synthase [Clostridia bacterium]|nr:3-dehydroquinate synthase [Clostridia bacterium]